ncbi:MAG TPA: hypothetical protein VHT73_09845 [Thermodesulfobacteriota bacterium]|nr:hypothetical protein [Thermodesulfobacteriota bacterium]
MRLKKLLRAVPPTSTAPSYSTNDDMGNSNCLTGKNQRLSPKEEPKATLTLTLGPMQTSMFEAIAELDGADPISSLQLCVNKFLNHRWDFENWKAKEEADDDR